MTTDSFDGFDLDIYIQDWHAILDRDHAALEAMMNHERAWAETETDDDSPACPSCAGTGRESLLTHDGGQESWPCPEGCREPAPPARTEAYEVYDYENIPY